MTSFDFLRSAEPSTIRKVLDFRIPHRLHTACIAFATVLAFVTGACGIESQRLHTALAVELQYQTGFERSQTAVARARIYYDDVERLAALDNRVAEITVSGAQDARRLAEIANALPAQAWLTSIAREGRQIVLDGDTQSLTVLGNALQSFASRRSFDNPKLIKAESESGSGTRAKYTLQLESRTL